MPKPIPASWEVPQVFRDRVGEQAGRQRAMVAEGHLLLILHSVPDPDEPDERVARLFWRSPEGAWRCAGQGSGIGALRQHVASFAEALQQLEDAVERAASANDYFAVLHRVAPTRHSTHNMVAVLQVARETVAQDKDLITMRDRAVDLERAAELIHGYARDGLEFSIARRGEEQARASRQVERSAHRLNLLAALTLPVTAVGSVMGINLEHGLEHWRAPWPFLVVTLACFVLGFWVKSLLAREG